MFGKLPKIGLFLSLAILFASLVHASPVISPDVPLSSPVYGYIEKLDGLGCLPQITTGTKPYTRIQMAEWIYTLEKSNQAEKMPAYARTILKKLHNEFTEEISSFTQNKNMIKKYKVTEYSLEEAYYKGNILPYAGPKASSQPLNNYQNGLRYDPHFNTVVSFNVEGQPADNLVFSVTPRFMLSDADTSAELEAGYVVTKINHVAVKLGKEEMHWGQASHGGLILANQAAPQTMLQLSNMKPMHFGGLLGKLGTVNAKFFYAELEDDRTKHNPKEVDNPSFTGLRLDFTPTKDFTFAVSRTSILGGKGHNFSRSDYWDFLTGKNAEDSESDKWNSIAGVDFRLRLPKANDIQLYGELYGEDQANYLPSHVAKILGIYIPRLSETGDWDATFEYAHTSPVWYVHSLYSNGYVYKGNIMGDAMGTNARRYYGKLTHYTKAGDNIAFNFERLKPITEHTRYDALWISYLKNLSHDITVEAYAGTYHNGDNQMFKLKLTQGF